MANAMLNEKLELFKQQLLADKKKSAVLGVLFLVLIVVLIKTFAASGDPDSAEAGPPPAVAAPPAPVTPIATPPTGAATGSIVCPSAGNPVARRESLPEDEPLKVVRVADLPRTLERDLFVPEQWSRYESSRGAHAGSGGGTTSQPAPSAFWTALVGGMKDYHAVRQREAGEITQELSTLTLQSTMTGPVPLAYISGRLVHEGSEINGFVVMRISDRHVLVRKYGQTRTLTMR
ncbi:MAG: hypothetical protein HBSAPP02_07150 [Phycisphaerae bacterium]|nr:MAG: hypothetical protein HBSAPP02_07150 [Phycisphaerae bacterium]